MRVDVRQTLLIIDDSPPIHSLVKARLRDEGLIIHSAHDGNEGLAMAIALKPDVILLDLDMPGLGGFEVCRRIKSDLETASAQVIFCTGTTSTAEKIEGLNLGAVDYVTKPFDAAELWARVRASLRTKFLLDLLSKKAMVDGLTGLYNRAYLDQRLNSETSLARRSGAALSVILIDVDHFKTINDQFGHPFGDEVLRSVATVLQEECRTEDVICRYGGEEFLVVSPTVGAAGAAILAERLRVQIAERGHRCGNQVASVTCSFGVAALDNSARPIVAAADAALYAAKFAGRNQVVVAASQGTSAHGSAA